MPEEIFPEYIESMLGNHGESPECEQEGDQGEQRHGQRGNGEAEELVAAATQGDQVYRLAEEDGDQDKTRDSDKEEEGDRYHPWLVRGEVAQEPEEGLEASLRFHFRPGHPISSFLTPPSWESNISR